METQDFFFNITAVKQEADDKSSNDDKDFFGSTSPTFSIEHKVNLFATSQGIFASRRPKSDQLEQELNTGSDKVYHDNAVSKRECGTPCVPGLTGVCLNQEMNVDFQKNELPINICVFAEKDIVKQEVCHIGETPFERYAYEKTLPHSSNLHDHQRTLNGGNPFECNSQSMLGLDILAVSTVTADSQNAFARAKPWELSTGDT
ncbi:hypothetical protein QYM36_006649 [Artemia franciscana]|uniref:Uncharacterized protein n=1 Tax=Artemia franciscana TaxID=6661 RepID=A0AA88HVL6_ARTSF|nr:hypothetical protein QYM36_006649 [Artemia franciscana]